MLSLSPRDFIYLLPSDLNKWPRRYPLPIDLGLDLPSLLSAYGQGIFPWPDADGTLLWYSPDPRAVLFTADFHISKRVHRSFMRLKSTWTTTFDQAFDEVVDACAQPRPYQKETWLTADLCQVYKELYRQGYAHSVEVWNQGQLIGGLYGLGLGRIFFGESMFSRVSNASRWAAMNLCKKLSQEGVPLIDCQVPNFYLASMGAKILPRDEFYGYLKDLIGDFPYKRWNW